MDCEVRKPLYRIYRDEVLEMEKEFKQGNLENALQHEQAIRDLLRCIFHPDVKDSITYEMHKNQCTQMSWPYRARNTLNAKYEKFLKSLESGYEDEV